MRGNYRNRKKGIVLKSGFGRFCLLFAMSLLCLAAAYGAEYPSKTIQIICPFPPGGKSDITARLVNQKLSTLMGQQVIVVNKGGGMGTVGVQTAAAAPADGYTILVSPSVIIVAPLTIKGARFSLKDFTPISLAVSSPTIISVKKDAPWKTLEELIAEAKRNPGKLSYSSPGPNTLPHLAGELFKMATATDITHVPMDGGAKSVSAVLGGHTNMTFHDYGTVKSHLDAGSLRPLVVMSRMHLEEFPDIPTMIEMGYPKMISTTWVGFFVPVKTPSLIVKKISGVFSEALKDKEIVGMFKKTGDQIENLSSMEAQKFFTEEQERLTEVIKKAKVGE